MGQHSEHVYCELRRMAGHFMRRERPGHTLQPTALANEAFLHLGRGTGDWDNTAHYFGAAARAMRQILTEHARGRRALKRGGDAARVPLDDLAIAAARVSDESFTELEDALEALGRHDPQLLKLVELRYFAGHTLEDIAQLTGRSLASVKRDWNYTRAWLFEYLTR